MKTYTHAILASSLLALTPGIYAQSFADWSGITRGASTGTAQWDGYGTVTYQIDYFPNSDGYHSGTNPGFTPNATSTNVGDLDPWNINDPNTNNWLRFVAGSEDGTNVGVGYELTFTFDDGNGVHIFPANDPVFYLSDVDWGDFHITATKNGNLVDSSDWYVSAVQTASAAWDAANPNQNWPGTISTWNSATSSLEGAGQSSLWVHQFRPTSEFDEITFTYTNGNRGDVIFFAVGDVVAIPEPSALLLGLMGLTSLLLNRRR